MAEYIAIAVGSVLAILLMTQKVTAPFPEHQLEETKVEETKEDFIDQIVNGKVDIDKINSNPQRRKEILLQARAQLKPK